MLGEHSLAFFLELYELHLTRFTVYQHIRRSLMSGRYASIPAGLLHLSADSDTLVRWISRCLTKPDLALSGKEQEILEPRGQNDTSVLIVHQVGEGR